MVGHIKWNDKAPLYEHGQGHPFRNLGLHHVFGMGETKHLKFDTQSDRGEY